MYHLSMLKTMYMKGAVNNVEKEVEMEDWSYHIKNKMKYMIWDNQKKKVIMSSSTYSNTIQWCL